MTCIFPSLFWSTAPNTPFKHGENSRSQSSSSRSGGDEEGLRDWIVSFTQGCQSEDSRTGRVDGTSWLPRVGGERGVGWVRSADESLGSLDGSVGAVHRQLDGRYHDDRTSSHAQVVSLGLGGRLAHDELPPGLVTLVDDLDGVLLGLGLTREGKDVLYSQPEASSHECSASMSSPLAFHRGFCRFGTIRWWLG